MGLLEKPALKELSPPSPKNSKRLSPLEKRKAFCLLTNQVKDFQVYRRADLAWGDFIDGPAIVDEGVARTVIHSGQSLSADEFGNLLIKT